MHLFSDYIEPLTVWLFLHPNWALLITFLISFAESLAIIGSIVPGSITMTAIGILAGSGVMRIDLTLIAAILGAIAGDSGSYALGYKYSGQLLNIWPFKKYPHLINYGKQYFDKHGEVSVIIGRFVGPIRSIIPVIAGMMHMNQWHFIIANVISAVFWAILYVVPGILIGAASNELSPENATQLFIVILIALAIIWTGTIAVKWLYTHAKRYFRSFLNKSWSKFLREAYLGFILKKITPKKEFNHSATASLIFLGSACIFVSLLCLIYPFKIIWVYNLNNSIYHFSQSLRTNIFDNFFIFNLLIINPLIITTIIFTTTCCTLYLKDYRTTYYWIILCCITFIIYFLIPQLKLNPIIGHEDYSPFLFPKNNLFIATPLYLFVIFYLRKFYRTIPIIIIRLILAISLLLSGIGNIYLGDFYLTQILLTYLLGITVFIWHWIFYRCNLEHRYYNQMPILIAVALVTLNLFIEFNFYFKQYIQDHYPRIQQYVLTNKSWWDQKKPILPIYTTTRMGRQNSFLNIQYVGSLPHLQQTLEKNGWKNLSSSFFYNLILKAGGHQFAAELPFTADIYQNKKPLLIMTFTPSDKPPILVLRIWQSNYHLQNNLVPIWIGSMVYSSKTKKHNQEFMSHMPYKFLMDSLPGFTFKQITFVAQDLNPLTSIVASPTILLIKE